MSKTLQRTILGAGAVFVLLLASTAAHTETESHDSGEEPVITVITLDLYDLTDAHRYIEQMRKKGVVREAGLPAMNCYLKQARTANPNSSFALLGGNIGASPYTSDSLKDNPAITALNTMPPPASTIGNHELDMGQAVSKQCVDDSNPGEFVQTGFSYFGADIGGMGTWMKGGVETSYLSGYKVWILPSGVKVVFIGATAEDVPYKLDPGTIAGLSSTDPFVKTDALVKSIKDKDEAQIVIAMLNGSVKNNYPKVSEYTDGIMGGDTHVLYELDKIDPAGKPDSRNPLLAGVALGSYTDNLDLTHITYDITTEKVLLADAQLIPAMKVAECGVDPETQAVVS